MTALERFVLYCMSIMSYDCGYSAAKYVYAICMWFVLFSLFLSSAHVLSRGALRCSSRSPVILGIWFMCRTKAMLTFFCSSAS